MDERQFQHIFKQTLEEEIPTVELWKQIEAGLPAAPRRTVHTSFRLGRAAVIIMLLTMTAVTAYAFYQTVIQPDPGIEAVQNRNLVVDINQTQTVEAASQTPTDITTSVQVTLDYAYADANRITVAFSAASASPEIDLYLNPTLTDSSGNQYLWLSSSGQQLIDRANSSVNGIMSFDASGITGSPAMLDLNLKIEVAYTSADLRANEPLAMILAGSTMFNMELPFNPGQAVPVNQMASSADLTMEVRQVVIAPSLTRVDVCFGSTSLFGGEAWLDWKAVASVMVEGTSIIDRQDAGIEGFIAPTEPCRQIIIPTSLVDQHGNWTLTIHTVRNTVTGESRDGEWTFTFAVPEN